MLKYHSIRGKKGFNDIVLFMIMLLYIIVSTTIVINIEAEFTDTTSEVNYDDLANLSGFADIEDPQEVGFIDFIKGFFKINFLFGAGDFNLWFGIFNSVLTYSWLFLIGRNIWVGGGA